MALGGVQFIPLHFAPIAFALHNPQHALSGHWTVLERAEDIFYLFVSQHAMTAISGASNVIVAGLVVSSKVSSKVSSRLAIQLVW